MSAMQNDHASQLARLKDASEKELLKVQHEKYVLSVVSKFSFVKLLNNAAYSRICHSLISTLADVW